MTPCRRAPRALGGRGLGGYVLVAKGRERPRDKRGWSKGRALIGLHRWVIEQIDGPIPPGLVVMHLCDTPDCFRYDHLKVGTQRQNVQDMLSKGRWRAATGDGHGAAKLTQVQVVEIRRLGEAGVHHDELAERFGVSRSSIRNVITRKTWKAC